MRMQVSGNLGGLAWFGPAVVGVFLILIGLLILAYPQLIVYAIAGVFMAGGLSMLGFALRVRRNVSYHRIDAWGGS